MDKKERIYKAALKLFIQMGFDKTPTGLISREAGVATGTLFHYFRTKEDLINGLYLRCKDFMLSTMTRGIDTEKTYRGKLHRVYINTLEWGTEHADEFLFFSQFSTSPHIHEMTKEEGRTRFSGMFDLIREGIEREVLKRADTEYILTIIAGIINAQIIYLIAHRHLSCDPAFLEESFSFLWDSIKA
jgi:AcrR family transcriptional regulator